MSQGMGGAHVSEDVLLAEMRALRDRVTGITGTAVASRDGLIVKEDTGGVDPDNLAALAATWLALAQRMSSEVGQGALREATTRSSHGHVVIYAIGSGAVLVLIGDEGLDVGRLHRESQSTLDAIKGLLAGAPKSLSPPLQPIRLVCRICRVVAINWPMAGVTHESPGYHCPARVGPGLPLVPQHGRRRRSMPTGSKFTLAERLLPAGGVIEAMSHRRQVRTRLYLDDVGRFSSAADIEVTLDLSPGALNEAADRLLFRTAR
jgi:uncharacterized protein